MVCEVERFILFLTLADTSAPTKQLKLRGADVTFTKQEKVFGTSHFINQMLNSIHISIISSGLSLYVTSLTINQWN